MARKRSNNATDESILEALIDLNKLTYPTRSLYVVALIVAFQPVYYSHAMNGMSWYNIVNLIVYSIVIPTTTYILSRAYMVMVESEFWSRQRHFNEVHERDESVLRRLRLQIAIGRTFFFLNTVFFLLCIFLLMYIFRTADARVAYVTSSLATASLLWLIAQKNEESRCRRMKVHK